MFEYLKELTLKELKELKKSIIEKAEKKEGKCLPVTYLREINKYINRLNELNVFVDKIENDIAEIHFHDKQVIYINTKNLPKGAKEGDYFDVKFILNRNKTKGTKVTVKKLIEELSKDIDLQL